MHTAVWTGDGEVFTFGQGIDGKLGHGGHQNESVPRLVEALAGKKVVGASSGGCHIAVWTDEGEIFTFGFGANGMLGHGREEDEPVPRLVEALVGKKVPRLVAAFEFAGVSSFFLPRPLFRRLPHKVSEVPDDEASSCGE